MKHCLAILTLGIIGTLWGVESSGGSHYRCLVPGVPIGPGKRIGGLYQAEPCNPKNETIKGARMRLKIDEMERESRRKDIKGWVAWIVKLATVGVFLVGAYIHLKSKIATGKSLGSTIMGMAGMGYVYGAVIHFENKWSTLIEVLIMSGIVGLVAWRLYKWRNTDGTKRIKKATPVTPRGTLAL